MEKLLTLFAGGLIIAPAIVSGGFGCTGGAAMLYVDETSTRDCEDRVAVLNEVLARCQL
eukprot:gene10996-16667_t